jgi:hypothetical protein
MRDPIQEAIATQNRDRGIPYQMSMVHGVILKPILHESSLLCPNPSSSSNLRNMIAAQAKPGKALFVL